ncbi:MAG TPA: hypothetical protein PKA41_12820 [Verrucomicrobiota bacterium]|nr:hypothetical protein [Verrucomicrobiota bacterium]
MSATEILSELPKLKREERRAIARRVFELEDEREELEWAAQAADLAFQELDKLEKQDAPSKSR